MLILKLSLRIRNKKIIVKTFKTFEQLTNNKILKFEHIGA